MGTSAHTRYNIFVIAIYKINSCHHYANNILAIIETTVSVKWKYQKEIFVMYDLNKRDVKKIYTVS